MITLEILQAITGDVEIGRVVPAGNDKIGFYRGDDTIPSFYSKDKLLELAHDYLIDCDYTVTASTSGSGNVVSAISYEKDSHIGTNKDMYEAFIAVLAKVLKGN